MVTEWTVLWCEHVSNMMNGEIRSSEWRESKCDTPATCLAMFWPANPETKVKINQILFIDVTKDCKIHCVKLGYNELGY
jgi:hypothetical protein